MNKHLVNEKTSLILFATVFLLYALVYMTKVSFSAAIAAIVKEGYLTKSNSGAISASFYITYGIGQLFGGFAADRFSPYKLIFGGLMGAFLCNAAMSVANGFVPMLIIWSVNGAVQFGIWPSIVRIITTNLAEVHKVKAIIYIGLAGVSGSILSYGTAAIVTGWRDSFTISAAVMALISVVWILVSRFSVPQMVPYEANSGEDKKDDKKISGRQLFITNGLIFLLASHALYTIVSQGATTWMPTMIIETYKNVSVSFASTVVIIMLVFNALTTFAIKMIYPGRVKNMIWTSLIFGIAAIPFSLLLSLNGKVSLVLITVFLCGMSAMLNMSYPFASNLLIPKFAFCGKTGTISGIINSLAAFGFVIANYGFGSLSDIFSWTAIIYIWAALIILRLLFMFLALPLWNRFASKFNP